MDDKMKTLKIVFGIVSFICLVLFGIYLFERGDSDKKKVVSYPEDIKIMQYDINHGFNPNKELNLKQVEEVINEENPHIVCLNRVDKGTKEAGYINQIKKLGKNLEMKYSYGKRYERGSGSTGNALLTDFPIKFAQNIFFESGKGRQNSILYVIVNYKGLDFHIFILHLDDKMPRKQYREAKEIISEKDITSGHVVIAGNFSLERDENEIKEFSELYNNVLDSADSNYTYSIPEPDKQYDYIFTGKKVEVVNSKVRDNESIGRVSYHLPVVSTVKLR